MVKTKHQKSKNNKDKQPQHEQQKQKQPHNKKHGKQADISEFRAQLDTLGLKIILVTADGNCFFRALADQLEGNEDEHEKYRRMVVQFIEKNREMFEPFIEDEVPFDEYCQSMGEDGTWAGHMELQAASLVIHRNICIHQHMAPRWYIQNFNDREAQMIHLSYHDGEHYNSVRLKEDTCLGPARPVKIKADADLSATSHRGKDSVTKSKEGTNKHIIQAGSIKMVMAGSGCENAEKVEQVLLQVGGNVDSAIEFLIAEHGTEENLYENNDFRDDASHGGRQDKNAEQCKEEPEGNEQKQESPSNANSSLQHDEKKIPRNKACPCGSKKKYKSCCGSVVGRSFARFDVNQTVDYGKGRKDKKQGKRPFSAANSQVGDGGTPDVGALCI